MAQTNLIIKTGEKLPSLTTVNGDYEDWIATISNWGDDDYQTVAVYLGEDLPPIESLKSIIITGAGAMVTDNDSWISKTSIWLAHAAKQNIPILGICFGHQLLAHALGGKIGDNPAGVEVGSVSIQLTPEAGDDALFINTPEKFTANVTHMQSVIELPQGAHLLAYSDREPVHAFHYGQHIWGIQFHPEFDGEIIKHFVLYFEQQLNKEGRDMASIQAHTGDTPESHSILKQFAQLVK